MFMDTGLCIPESVMTLELQQRQLLAGKRIAQMFPIGTCELPLQPGLSRYLGKRGIFHFRPDCIDAAAIDALSSQGRENEFLNLGPISKPEIADRMAKGETLVCITEKIDGVELRSAAGTDKTMDSQRDYFERTKEPGSVIVIGAAQNLYQVLGARLAEMK